MAKIVDLDIIFWEMLHAEIILLEIKQSFIKSLRETFSWYTEDFFVTNLTN